MKTTRLQLIREVLDAKTALAFENNVLADRGLVQGRAYLNGTVSVYSDLYTKRDKQIKLGGILNSAFTWSDAKYPVPGTHEWYGWSGLFDQLNNGRYNHVEDELNLL